MSRLSKIEEGIKAPLAKLNISDWEGVWMAGGALRCLYMDESIKDYDLVFDSRERLQNFTSLCNDRGWKHSDNIDQTIVQIDGYVFDCSSFYKEKTLAGILGKYDLTHSLIGCDMQGDIYIDDRCRYAMDTRSFKIANVILAGSTLRRIHKFLSEGWQADYPGLQDLWIDYMIKLKANKNVPIYSRTRV